MSFIPSAASRSRLCPTATKLTATFEQLETDYELESDIVDQCVDLIDEDIPQRPSSRLGFHSSPPASYATDMEDPSETILPPMINRLSNTDTDDPDSVDLASAFSSIAYDMDEDITAVASSRRFNGDLLKPHTPPFLGLRIDTTAYYDNSNPFLSSDDESDISDSELESEYSCDSSDEDFDFSPTSISFLRSKSRLAAPPLVAPVARHLPSPTEPFDPPSMSAELPPTAAAPRFPYKLNHNNHGYSRQALLHLKWFWTLREGKWAEDDNEQHDSKAYDGLASSGQPSRSDGYGAFRCPTQRNLAQRLKTQSPPPRSPTLPPMSIHPRRGDIASLRDPYCAHIDRCFVNIPSWTLAKTLYMFDVHIGHEWHNRLSSPGKWKEDSDSPVITNQLGETCTSTSFNESSNDASDDVDLDSESESLGTSASVASGDDSDATLVESESEGDLEREDYSTCEAFMSDAGPSSPLSNSEDDQDTPRLKCSLSPPIGQQSPKYPISPKLYAQMRSPRTGFFSFLNDDTESTKPWATNWYRRWEILMELMRFNWGQDQLFAALSINEQQYQNDSQSCPSSSGFNGVNSGASRKGKRRLKRQPRFFFADDNSADDDDPSWEWDLAFDLDNKGKISEPSLDFGYKLEDSVLM